MRRIGLFKSRQGLNAPAPRMQSREMNRGLTQPAADRFGIFAPGGNQQELETG
jgi:hypothetical protein